MPVAYNSRRKQSSHRQNSEDIEDVRNTQENGDVDDVSDEDRPKTTKKVVKKEPRQTNGKQRADPDDDDDDGGHAEDEDEDEDDRIDVHNLPDQPLRKADMHKLNGMSEDWLSMKRQINQNAEIYREVAAAMAEAGEPELESSEDLQRLHNEMKEFLDVTAEMVSHAQSLKDIHKDVVEGKEITNSLQAYKDGVENLKDQYAGKTTRQKYFKSNEYKAFHTAIWDVHRPGEPMPPLTELIPKEDGDESDDDDELEMGEVTQNFECPITLTLLVNPVTSRICQHSFSADSIKEHFRSGPSTKKCPAAGCNKSFKFTDCLPDKNLANKVANFARRRALKAQNDDADEVVD